MKGTENYSDAHGRRILTVPSLLAISLTLFFLLVLKVARSLSRIRRQAQVFHVV